jgi:hypothetical protein
MTTTRTLFQSLLCPSLCLLLGCATGAGAKGGGTGSATSEQVVARNQALDKLIVEALTPCKAKGKPEDHGLIVVTAKADGSIGIGAMQWLGSEEMKACILAEAPKARLQPWSGPQVTWIWAIGTKDSPAPKPLAEAPLSYKERLGDHMQRMQARVAGAADPSSGPMAACAQRSLAPEAFALVHLRLFIFPDGKVVGATPLANDGEGRDAAYTDCLVDSVREWTFDGFQAPGFTTLDVPLKLGIDPKEKG